MHCDDVDLGLPPGFPQDLAFLHASQDHLLHRYLKIFYLKNILLYNIIVVSAIYQHESALVYIHHLSRELSPHPVPILPL